MLLLDQILDTLKAHPNSSSGEIAAHILGAGAKSNQVAKVSREVACAARDKLIVPAHITVGGKLRAVYRLTGDDPPIDATDTTPKPQPIPPPKREHAPMPPAVSLHEPSTRPARPFTQLDAAVDSGKSSDRQSRKAIIRSLEQQTKVLRAAKVPVQNYNLKITVVAQLAELFSDDIAKVLSDVCDDMGRLADIVGVEQQ